MAVRGNFGVEFIGIKGIQKNFQLRTAMGITARRLALQESAAVIKKEMVRLAPPYPVYMLKYGYRWWTLPTMKPTLKQSIRLRYSGASGYEDVEVGPTRDTKKWLALEFGHPKGWYGPRPFVRPALYNNVNQIRAINRKHFSKITA